MDFLFLDEGDGIDADFMEQSHDFYINEINADGSALYLADHGIPKPATFTKEQWGALEEMMSSAEASSVVIDVSTASKQLRFAMHTALLDRYGDTIKSNTKTTGKISTMTITKNSAPSVKRPRLAKGKKYLLPEGKVVQFAMYTENISTSDAIDALAKKLKVPETWFTVSQKKGKKSIATQLVTAKFVDPDSIRSINNSFAFHPEFNRQIMVGNFKLVSEPMQPSLFKGNRYSITLRNAVGDDVLIKEKLERLRENGFVNYFASTTDPNSKLIGQKIIANQWKEATDLVLLPESTVKFDPNHDLNEAKKNWQATHDPEMAIKLIRNDNKGTSEFKLLDLLNKHQNDYASFNKLPEGRLRSWVQSYQRDLWNRLATKRLSTLGFKPVIGDLVCDRRQGGSGEIIAVEAQNIDDFSIRDVVLPLPGHGITFPANEVVAGWYSEMLAGDGLNLNSLEECTKSLKIESVYRPLVVKPDQFSFTLVRYDDDKKGLLMTDCQFFRKTRILHDPPSKIRGGNKPSWPIKRFGAKFPVVIKEKPTERPRPAHKEGGAYMAIVLEFTIPPSTHFSMLVREILKEDV